VVPAGRQVLRALGDDELAAPAYRDAVLDAELVEQDVAAG
jgi:hypothetical protein